MSVASQEICTFPVQLRSALSTMHFNPTNQPPSLQLQRVVHSKGCLCKSIVSSPLVTSEANSVWSLSRALNGMRKLWEKHGSHQWAALQHGPLNLLLSHLVCSGGRETSWLLPSLLTSPFTSATWNNGEKIINFRARPTAFKSWLCYVLFVWPSVGYLITGLQFPCL